MKLGIVVFDGIQALDVAGPMDVFAEANTFLPEDKHYEISLIGLRPGPVRCSNGMEISVPYDYKTFPDQCDLLLVAGGPRLPEAESDPEALEWLRMQAHCASRYGSICNGTFLLGHAGLLDGRQVTTHWSDAKLLAERFPRATLQPDMIYVRDGKLITSAGVTAGIDLCLSLVAEDFGNEVAVKVAKRLVVYVHRDGGQSQYSPFLATGMDEDSIVSAVLRYVIEHITEALTMDQLADAVSVSRRTFSRVFSKYAKVTPAVFVEQVRVDFARKLLEETDVPLKTVAFNCGFHSAPHMRMIFMRRLNITPKQYRERFRGIEGVSERSGKDSSNSQRSSGSASHHATTQ